MAEFMGGQIWQNMFARQAAEQEAVRSRKEQQQGTELENEQKKKSELIKLLLALQKQAEGTAYKKSGGSLFTGLSEKRRGEFEKRKQDEYKALLKLIGYGGQGDDDLEMEDAGLTMDTNF